ncbi:MAG: NCS2 family permease [Elusimicrobium sp.]|jgi:AGZA family xanthine/uracil permease-like MFS transporter|nr:NCS2 family permease [Elusimicrobium sp.]
MIKKIDRFFHITERGSSFKTEFTAGLATGLSMIYIIAVNPAILGTIGGIMQPGSIFTATILVTVISTLLMGFLARVPVAVSIGMGLNAYFAFVVCGAMGFDPRVGLAAIFLEGTLFFLVSICGLRESITKAIPDNIKTGIAVSIGVFIALVGLIHGGVVIPHPSTIVSFAKLTQGPALLTFIGLIIIVVLHANKIPGGVIIAIVLTTLIGIPMGVTVMPEHFNPFSMPAKPYMAQFDFSQIFTGRFALVLVTLAIANFFDTVGTLTSVLSISKLTHKNGNFPHIKEAYVSDSLAAVISSVFSVSPATAYVESGVGAAAGARTGFANIATALLFLAALFFSPVFLIMPASATAPALIFVGYLMMSQITEVQFADFSEGFPVYLGILACVFGYSITTGIIFSVISYTVIKICIGKAKEVPLGTYLLTAFFILQFFLPK